MAEFEVSFKDQDGNPVSGLIPDLTFTSSKQLPDELKVSFDGTKINVDASEYNPSQDEIYVLTITANDTAKTISQKHAGSIAIALTVLKNTPITGLVVNVTKLPSKITKGETTSCDLTATHIEGTPVTIKSVSVQSDPFGDITGAWNTETNKLDLIGNKTTYRVVVTITVTDDLGSVGTGEKTISVADPVTPVVDSSTVVANPTSLSVDGYSTAEDTSNLTVKFFDQQKNPMTGIVPKFEYELSKTKPEGLFINFTNNNLVVNSAGYNPTEDETYTITVYCYDDGGIIQKGFAGSATVTLSVKHVVEPELTVDTSKITGPLEKGTEYNFELSAILGDTPVTISSVAVESTPAGVINGQWKDGKLLLVGQSEYDGVNVKLTVTDTTNHTGVGNVHLSVIPPFVSVPVSSSVSSNITEVTLAGDSKDLEAGELTPTFKDARETVITDVEPSWEITSNPALPVGLTIDVGADNKLQIDSVNYNPDVDTTYAVTIKAFDKYKTIDPTKATGVTIDVTISNTPAPEHTYAIDKFGETTQQSKWITEPGQYAYFRLTDKGTVSLNEVKWSVAVDKESLQSKITFLDAMNGLLYIDANAIDIDGAQLTITANSVDGNETYATRDITIEATETAYTVTPNSDEQLSLKYDDSCKFYVLDGNRIPLSSGVEWNVLYTPDELAGKLTFEENSLVLDNSVTNFTVNDYIGVSATFTDATQGEITLNYFYNATPYNISNSDVKNSYIKLNSGDSTTFALNKFDIKMTSGVQWKIINYGTTDPFTAAELKIDSSTGKLTVTDYLDHTKEAAITITATYSGVTKKFDLWLSAVKQEVASSFVSADITSVIVDGNSKKANIVSLVPTFLDAYSSEVKGVYPSWEISTSPELPTGLKITVDAYNMLQIDSTDYNPDSTETFTVTIKANTREKTLASDKMQSVTITVTIRHSY